MRYFCRPPYRDARVAELVDARDSNSRSARSVGSIPTPGTRKPRIVRGFFCLEPLGLHGRILHGMTPLFTCRPCWVAGLLALTNTLGYAQVTVNSIDLPQGGTTYTFQNALPDFGLNLESTGPGWIWDFSDMEVQDSTDVQVQDISDASFSAQFAFNGFDPDYQADHFYTVLSAPDFGDAGGDFGIAIDELTGYFQVSGSTYNQVGVGLTFGGLELPVAFEDIDELHPVPLTADASLTSTAVYEIAVPATFTYAVDQVRTVEVDGYGTLLLPDGTTHEVLRLKSTVVSDDSVYFNLAEQGFSFPRETVTYAWLGEGGMPWMEVVTNLGIPSLVRYQGSAPEPEGISALGQPSGEAKFSFHPNPVKCGQRVKLTGSLNASWSVHALDGRTCMTFAGNGFSTQGLTPAVYVVRNLQKGATRRLLVQ